MVLKLHGFPVSPSTARVEACLHEKALDFEFVPVNILGLENKQPSFLAKNPFGQIPAFEDGDVTLFEAALVKVWIEVESQQYHPAICPIVYEFFGKPVVGCKPDQTVIDASLEKLEKVLDVYETKLSSNKYLAGDFYSLADLHHFAYTFYFMKTPWSSLINDRPHVKAWWEDISARPASVKVAEGMNFGEVEIK
ncbi:PREDICTED: glutathione [Prunus dulcis]|uniref:glutathione transferase n=1 Tax=Prunus dulcis TaxID=3755 RepID=A0A5E4EEK4_PRUDU|nr:PREDICTED: glutathione [Prunus dulcis]